MPQLYALQPEIAGGWGPTTVVTNREQLQSGEADLPEISHLEYCFDDWSGDDLLAVHSCFIVTDRLARSMTVAGLTGARFDRVKITTSSDWQQWRLLNQPRPALPPFRRLIPEGKVTLPTAAEAINWRGHDVSWGTASEPADTNLDVLLERVAEALRQKRTEGDAMSAQKAVLALAAAAPRRHLLVVTRRCLDVLQQHQLNECVIQELTVR